jgi:hypothetical protein
MYEMNSVYYNKLTCEKSSFLIPNELSNDFVLS